MNETVRNFLIKQNIDLEKISESTNPRVYSKSDINLLAYRYGIYEENIDSEVSIADIVGYDYNLGEINPKNIGYGLSNFFNENGSNYQTRSLGMLEYSKDEIMEKLEDSFYKERIYVQQLDEEKYIVSTNGKHRYNILRLHYLNELSNAKTEEEKEFLRNKYTIPVSNEKLDYTKTYCNYLLENFTTIKEENFFLSSEYDNRYHATGNSVLYLNGEKITLDDENLILYVRNNLDENLNLDMIDYYRETIPTFDAFIDKHFKGLGEEKTEERKI